MVDLCEGGNEPAGSLKGICERTAGYTKWNLKRNEDITKKLNAQPILRFVSHYQIKWGNRFQRVSASGIPKEMLSFRPQGKISLGQG
ncbi:hypothetical protein ANN_23159 [Periplaneta americana]|uniref:Uncharacterized protein n=1 Tax=Periplaneta americana TaxID=6978 RepID=A0ABQ8SLK0_PERAM|nr:hypothetical protein ANN_23159 [Periplaneta americana]